MKVVFDSNVWRIVCSPCVFPCEASIASYLSIRKAIKEKRFEPFISETAFTLEAIPKKDRKTFFSEYKPKTVISEKDVNDTARLSSSIGPDREAHPGNNAHLRQHLADAVELGFKVLRLPRIAGIVNQDVEAHLFNPEDLDRYIEKAFAAEAAIESRGAGVAVIKGLGLKYSNGFWLEGIKLAPEHESGNIQKAVAEWADGDSVACCIAVGADYLCTRDLAKKSGDRSIFSQANRDWLNCQYGVQIISPETLASVLKGCPDQ